MKCHLAKNNKKYTDETKLNPQKTTGRSVTAANR